MEYLLSAEQTLGVILGLIAIIGAILAYTKFWYKKGGTDATHIMTDKSLIKRIDDIKKQVKIETDAAEKAHNILHNRIDKTNEKLDNQGEDIAYIRGQIDTFLKKNKNK